MANSAIREALITILKSKRRKLPKSQRHRPHKPTRWLYPWTTEKHYAAAIRGWLRPMTEYVHEYIKNNIEDVLHGDDAILIRNDAIAGKQFRVMVNSLNAWVGQYVPDDPEKKGGSALYMGLGNIADTVYDFNEAQYEKSAKASLGIEFPTGEQWWPDASATWKDRNYQLIRSDMTKYIGQVNDMTEQAVTAGMSVKQLSKQIQGLDDGIKRSRANFLARDQIGKLNGQVTQARMEDAGLSMYIWSTSNDERVRDSHAELEGKLCRWDDPTVYSEDGGKTWKDRPSDWVQLHPGQDFQCRCTAIAYWDELIGEADKQIDLLAEEDYTLGKEGARVMPLSKSKTSSENLKQQQETEEKARIQKNEKATKETAKKVFPKEAWVSADELNLTFVKKPDGIQDIKIAKSRFPVNKSQENDLLKEIVSAKVLKDKGASVYIIPKMKRPDGSGEMPGPDAIVNGKLFEFKVVTGKVGRVEDRFRESRVQGESIYIRIENDKITRKDVVRKLYGIVNDPTYTGGYQGNVVFSTGNGDKQKTYFVSIKSLKKQKKSGSH